MTPWEWLDGDGVREVVLDEGLDLPLPPLPDGFVAWTAARNWDPRRVWAADSGTIAALWSAVADKLPPPGSPRWLSEWMRWSVALGRVLAWVPMAGTGAAWALALRLPKVAEALGAVGLGPTAPGPVVWANPAPGSPSTFGPVLGAGAARAVVLTRGEAVAVAATAALHPMQLGTLPLAGALVEAGAGTTWIEAPALAPSRAVASLLFGSWMLGAAAGGLLLVRHRLRHRRQFGRPVSRLQVVRHTLVDHLAALAPLWDLLEAAAEAAEDDRAFLFRATMAGAQAIQAGREVLRGCGSLHGGYAFLRAYPGSAYAVAQRLLEPAAGEVPDLLAMAHAAFESGGGSEAPTPPVPLFPAETAVKAAVGEFCRQWAQAGVLWPDVGNEVVPAFYQALCARGWIGMHWPRELGGQGGTRVMTALVIEELTWALMPDGGVVPAVAFLGDLLWACGSPTQQRRWMPAIAAGTVMACLGLTEPEAGSDLTAVATRAEWTDAGWRLEGTKIFTGVAHQADVGIVLARTGPPGEDRHRGLTVFLVDFHQPGVVVEALDTVGGWRQNCVRFEGALAGPEDVIGGVGEGWSVLMTLINLERSAIARLGLVRRILVACRPALGPKTAARWLQVWAEMEGLRRWSYRLARAWTDPAPPSPMASSLMKLRSADLLDAAVELAREVLGPWWLVPGPKGPAGGFVEAVERNRAFFQAGGGVAGVQKDAIARFGLRLDDPT
ncbi:MAG: acyl-CoA dehydrogenase family protein [Firmicutes bacterium]|nr:acyl-CoA dehydrogenase family protein [Alicyclobacillaceae bacterium]MCL6497365.1 acyl-CoA dehydrogenase family protein [Bacillota bacterium]